MINSISEEEGYCQRRVVPGPHCDLSARSLIRHCTCSGENEELKAFDLFYKDLDEKRDTGVFFEAGAMDGLWATNTMLIENCLGWRGVMMEGAQHQAEALARNRPHATKIFKAVCGEASGFVNFSASADAGSVAGIPELMDAGHKERYPHAVSGGVVQVHPYLPHISTWSGSSYICAHSHFHVLMPTLLKTPKTNANILQIITTFPHHSLTRPFVHSPTYSLTHCIVCRCHALPSDTC
jgi:hypothetical protein